MQQFEYKTFTVPLKKGLFSKKQEMDVEILEDELNLMGKMGWELTSEFARQANGFSQYTVLIFKRPLVKKISKAE